MLLRAEEDDDHASVYAVNSSAFDTPSEANLVNALREQARPLISIVAEDDGKILGHILFSPVSLSGNPRLELVGLAPMAVVPEHQRLGIGSALMRGASNSADSSDNADSQASSSSATRRITRASVSCRPHASGSTPNTACRTIRSWRWNCSRAPSTESAGERNIIQRSTAYDPCRPSRRATHYPARTTTPTAANHASASTDRSPWRARSWRVPVRRGLRRGNHGKRARHETVRDTKGRAHREAHRRRTTRVAASRATASRHPLERDTDRREPCADESLGESNRPHGARVRCRGRSLPEPHA